MTARLDMKQKPKMTVLLSLPWFASDDLITVFESIESEDGIQAFQRMCNDITALRTTGYEDIRDALSELKEKSKLTPGVTEEQLIGWAYAQLVHKHPGLTREQVARWLKLPGITSRTS